MLQVAEFTWGTTLQCFVLSSYFFGYLATQIPASWAVSRFGGKHVVTAAVGASTVLSLVTPVTARASVHAFIIIRVLLGACAVSLLFLIRSDFYNNNNHHNIQWHVFPLPQRLAHVVTSTLRIIRFENAY